MGVGCVSRMGNTIKIAILTGKLMIKGYWTGTLFSEEVFKPSVSYPNILRPYLPRGEGGTRDATNKSPVSAFVQCPFVGRNCPFFKGISVATMMWKGVKNISNPHCPFRQSKWPFAKRRSSPSCSCLSSVVANSLSSWAGICAINNDLLIHIPYKLHTFSHTHIYIYARIWTMYAYNINMCIQMIIYYIILCMYIYTHYVCVWWVCT